MRHLYTVAVFVIGWSFFWIGDSTQLVAYWKAMAGRFGPTGASTFWELAAWEYWPVFLICAVASTPVASYAKFRLVVWVEGRTPGRFMDEGLVNPRRIGSEGLCSLDARSASPARARILAIVHVAYNLSLLALLLASCASIVSGTFNPFIYFQL